MASSEKPMSWTYGAADAGTCRFRCQLSRQKLRGWGQCFGKLLSDPVRSLPGRVVIYMRIDHCRSHIGMAEDCAGHGESFAA